MVVTKYVLLLYNEEWHNYVFYVGFRYPSKKTIRTRRICLMGPKNRRYHSCFGRSSGRKTSNFTSKYNVEQNMSEQNVEKRYNLWTVESACRIEGVHNFWIL